MSTVKLYSTRSAQHRDLCTRVSDGPLISPSDVTPSDPKLEVIGALNPTFFEIDGKRHLIVRIDERPPDIQHSTSNSRSKNVFLVAHADIENAGHIELLEAKAPESYIPEKEPVLPESIRQNSIGIKKRDLLLSYISHLRIADLSGIKTKVRKNPAVFPDNQFNQYGCEDPRATAMENAVFVVYTAMSRFGATTWLAKVVDSASIENKIMLLGPDHKHSVLFPGKVGNHYYMLSRPLSRSYIRFSGAWLFRSPDLIHWGTPIPLILPRPKMWDSERVGPAISPVLTQKGWLIFYYGVDSENSYHTGAALLDPLDPTKVIARSNVPILSPILEWERIGRRADTVFPCGLEFFDKMRYIRLYYGAADTHVGAAEISMSVLLSTLYADRRGCI